jgi:hypothetical protein
MREADIVCELRAALRRRGVWGARAERLLQEWTEHVRDDAAHRIEQGTDPAAAQEAAWQALGSSSVLAKSAARELTQASWLGRHPWLGGLALPVLGWFGVIVTVAWIPGAIASLLGWSGYADSAKLVPALQCWAQAVNWLPWLLSLAWLTRIATRMPGGWKLFWATALTLVLFSSSIRMLIIPPSHGPGTGQIVFMWPTGMLDLIATAFASATGYQPTIIRSLPWTPYPVQTTAWFQSALLLFGAIAFHLKAASTRRAAGLARPA